MNTLVYGVIAVILFAVVEQLVAWLLERFLSDNSRLRHPVALVVAAIVLAVVAVSLPNESIAAPEPTPQTGLLYQLTVQDADTQNPIEGAVVILTVPGVSPFRGSTGVDGRAAIDGLPDEVLGKSAVLNIDAEGYEPHRLNVAVNLNQLPDLILLTKRE